MLIVNALICSTQTFMMFCSINSYLAVRKPEIKLAHSQKIIFLNQNAVMNDYQTISYSTTLNQS